MEFDAKLAHMAAQLDEIQRNLATLVFVVGNLADSNAEISKKLDSILKPSPNGASYESR